MRYKKATCIVNAVVIVLAAAFLVMTSLFPEPVVRMKIGAGYYPALLCIFLIIASVISTFNTLRAKTDSVVEIPKLKNIVLVLVTIILFLTFWRLTGMFYVVSFFALGILLFFLNPQPAGMAKLTKTLLLSVCMQGFVYIVFERLMNFRF
jgi:hypothetical protein